MRLKKSIVSVSFLCLGLTLLVLQCQPEPEDSQPAYVGTPAPLDVPRGFPSPNIPSDNPQTVEGIKLGRHLFYEKALSGDGTMSCGSCHMQERAFTDGSPVSIGIQGIPGRRKAMPLFNLAFHEHFFWDGRVATLEEQALVPIEDPLELDNTLQQAIASLSAIPKYPPMFDAAFGDNRITAARIGKAIAQFERTMISANSRFDSIYRIGNGDSLTGLELVGKNMFFSEEGDCFHCHGSVESSFLMGAFGRDLQFVNNGLKDIYTDKGRAEITGLPTDIGKFKVPSVRNVEFSFPFMHDGSIPSLDSIVEFYNFGGHLHPNVDPNMKKAGEGRNWTEGQKIALVAFLRTLTDYKFLTDTSFSDPNL